MLQLLQVVLITHGGCEAAWGHSLARASTAGHGDTGHALHAMMQCIAAECPLISWRAKDVSLAQAAPDVTDNATDTTTELTYWANTMAVPLLVSSARSRPTHKLDETVGRLPDCSIIMQALLAWSCTRKSCV